jgi:hypothetical protein
MNDRPACFDLPQPVSKAAAARVQSRGRRTDFNHLGRTLPGFVVQGRTDGRFVVAGMVMALR